MKIKKLSIIIPVYNEEETLAVILGRIEQAKIRPDIEKEIIIVDDGSTDGSREILEKYKDKYKIIFKEKNQGKGAALRDGFAVATGDYLIVHDADLEYNPDEIQLLIDKAERSDAKVVFGSRNLGKEKNENAGWKYYLGGKYLTFLTNLLYNTRITDEPTCYKMVNTGLIRELDIQARGFEFCPELTSKIAKRKIKIFEVPISYHPRSKKQGKKIKAKDGIIATWVLVKNKFL